MNNKIFKLILIFGVATTITFTPAAFAGHKNHHGTRVNHHYNNHHNSHHNSHHYSHRVRHHTRHHHSNHVIGSIIGGVILGSIIHDATRDRHVTYTNNRRYDNMSSRYYNTPVRVNKTIVLNNTPTQTYRVLNGQDCYLVNYNNAGAEVLTLVPKTNCGF